MTYLRSGLPSWSPDHCYDYHEISQNSATRCEEHRKYAGLDHAMLLEFTMMCALAWKLMKANGRNSAHWRRGMIALYNKQQAVAHIHVHVHVTLILTFLHVCILLLPVILVRNGPNIMDLWHEFHFCRIRSDIPGFWIRLWNLRVLVK